MVQYGFAIDGRRCIGCKTCVIACNIANGALVSAPLRKLIEAESGDWQNCVGGCMENNVSAFHLSMSCNHCSNPACVEACGNGAITKSVENGLVAIDSEICTGCRRCAEACPWNAIAIDKRADVCRKCDGCAELLSKGAVPACVSSCPQGALEFGEMSELEKKGGFKFVGPSILPKAEVLKPNLLIRPGKHYPN